MLIVYLQLYRHIRLNDRLLVVNALYLHPFEQAVPNPNRDVEIVRQPLCIETTNNANQTLDAFNLVVAG